MTNNESSVAFLGLCERVAYVREGNTNLFKWNVLGLKYIVLSTIYPLKLNGWTIALAIQSTTPGDKIDLRIRDNEGKDIGFFNISLSEAVPQERVDKSDTEETSVVHFSELGWTLFFFPIGETGIVINEPGQYLVTNGDDVIGQLQFVVIDPPPLTPERVAAIRSDPSAMKAIRMELGCTKCPSKFKLYTALEQSSKLEEEGYINANAVPNEFVCECGISKIDLRILKRNLHGLLGTRRRESEDINLIPLYERSSLENIRREFTKILSDNVREETVQQFIQEHPILLHQFPADEIFFKPPILTSFVADFGIVTPQKELILIEIEKATTRLMKKDGGMAANLSHAFDQVRDWLHILDEHRLAVLDEIGIGREKVSIIRGVVIAGRDSGYDAEHLRRLKGTDRGRVSFLTYDDILFSVDALIRKMETM